MTLIAIVDLPVPAAAVMTARPGARPDTTPAGSTVATSKLSDDQLTGASVRGSPFADLATAESFVRPPTKSGCFSAAISTRVTGVVFTMIFVNPGFPPTIAPTSTSPGWKKLTVPSSSAWARSNGAANHAVGFSPSVLPALSFAIAVNLSGLPTSASAAGNLISMVSTADALDCDPCAAASNESEQRTAAERPINEDVNSFVIGTSGN